MSDDEWSSRSVVCVFQHPASALRRYAVALLGLLVMLTSQLGGGSARSTLTTTAQAQPGVALAGIDRAVSVGGLIQASGWISDEAARSAVLVSGSARVEVTADQRRFDIAAVSDGATAWGFEAELGSSRAKTCIEVAGVTQDCVWTACTRGMFSSEFRSDLAAQFGSQRYTAYVIDDRTGCSYSLNEETVITTASVVKVSILAALLLESTPLSGADQRLAKPMMQLSLNPETARLWSRAGGVRGLTAADAQFGARSTAHTAAFGATRTTAKDRSQVAAGLLGGAGPLGGAAQEQAWAIMRGVHPAQQWGVTAGVGVGFEVVNKNGFYPLTGAGWQIGSTGYVGDPDGGGYAITVLTDRNDTQAEGVALVEAIAQRVNRRLTFGPVAARPWDDVECITNTRVGASWGELTLELGLSGSESENVRLAAGGDGPFRGQSACK